MLRGVLGKSLLCSLGATVLSSSAAFAALPHTVQPGETLWSISAANNLTTRTVAVYNGLPETAGLMVGTTVYVPTVAEGAAALASGAPAVAPPSTSAGAGGQASSAPATPPLGMGSVPSPYGHLPLAPAAADAWNAMRSEALSAYGTDIYPGGPASAYRTYQQQAELYEAYLAGHGAPANPPGTSSHELGTAVDVPTPQMRAVVDQIGWKYGWGKFHAPGEWWHVDYGGG
ncbi:MAG TPA: LysM peptidoglycan-binding domain-containing protein [Thermoleophilaceae bacterium]|jgi:LysM repeat protein|nr:LysM peptidoglycan-binding domain-containing protein [Thermoleophilaceae bacterium]